MPSFGLGTDLWILKEEIIQLAPFGSITLEDVDLTGKWAIVTGGSLGIGLELAKMLAEAGCNLIVTARPGKPGSDKGAKIVQAIQAGVKKSVTVEFWPMDGESLANTKELADRWLKTKRPLDFLVTNHGVAEPKVTMTDEGFERHYVINFLSHAYLTLLLLPSLAKAKAPRIIGVTSCFHYFGREMNWDKLSTTEDERWPRVWPIPRFMMKYGRSKLCLALFEKELGNKLGASDKYRHIITSSVHPGAVATNIFTDLYSWKDPILTAGAFYLNTIAISAKEGAKSIMKGLISDEQERSIRSGQYFNRAWRTTPRPELEDKATRERLWTRVFEECKLSEAQVFK